MRDLPDSASLDHLRRQAKDQLTVLRHSEATATLGEAQTATARLYGFDSWAELKAEVERRNAQPRRVADDDVAEQIAEAYGLGTPAGPMTHVEQQWTGQLWDLRTATGRWVVTALAEFVEPGNIETEAGLVERAIAAGVLAPEPVRTTAGGFVLTMEETDWRVHRWMRLGPPSPQPPLPRVAAEGGRTLARIHNLGIEPPEPVVPWLTRRLPEPYWRQLADAAQATSKVWADDFEQAIPGLLQLDAVCDPSDPNKRAILTKASHAPAAVRMAGAAGLVAIGWEHTSAVPGALNWTISRANIALNDPDPGERERAERNIRVLCRMPLALGSVRRLVAHIG